MYVGRMNFDRFCDEVKSNGMSLRDILDSGKGLYQKWYHMTYGLTDEQILALPNMTGVTQTELNDLKYAIGVFNTIASGTALDPATRDAYLFPFL